MKLKDVKIDIDRFKEQIKVDKNNLDVLWETHSELYFEYVEISSKCSEVIDDLKDKLGVATAELELKIRNKPDKYKIEKVTNDAIKCVLATTEKLIKRKEEINEWMYYDRILKGTLTTIEHRKRALSKETDLFLGGYFAQPNSKSSGVMEEKIEQRTKESIKNKLKKNKRLNKGKKS